jgi:hypothetical protein
MFVNKFGNMRQTVCNFLKNKKVWPYETILFVSVSTIEDKTEIFFNLIVNCIFCLSLPSY